MKRLFEEEVSMDELKRLIKNFKKKESSNQLIMIFVGVLAAVAVAAVVIMKVKNCGCFSKCEDDFDEDDFDYDDEDEDECDECCDPECKCDENGCNYTSEEDFEK